MGSVELRYFPAMASGSESLLASIQVRNRLSPVAETALTSDTEMANPVRAGDAKPRGSMSQPGRRSRRGADGHMERHRLGVGASPTEAAPDSLDRRPPRNVRLDRRPCRDRARGLWLDLRSDRQSQRPVKLRCRPRRGDSRRKPDTAGPACQLGGEIHASTNADPHLEANDASGADSHPEANGATAEAALRSGS
jgi:hypothetical protein